MGSDETEFKVQELRARRELRRLRVDSLLAIAGIVVAVVWLATWFPGGIRLSDYNSRVVSTVILLSAVVSAAAAVTAHWSRFLREEPISELWMILAGRSMTVRSSARLTRRVALQCRLASTDRRRLFALLVLQVRQLDVSGHSAPIKATLPALREALRD